MTRCVIHVVSYTLCHCTLCHCRLCQYTLYHIRRRERRYERSRAGLHFTKMSAMGNDYVYVELLTQSMEEPEKWARFLSDRRFGVGSDGMILICPSERADFRMRVFNPDGSEAEMCGNALRSVGKFVYEKNFTSKTALSIETLGGIK